MSGGQAQFQLLNERALAVRWLLNDGSTLMLAANLGNEPATVDWSCAGEVLFASDSDLNKNPDQGRLSPWTVIFCLEEPGT